MSLPGLWLETKVELDVWVENDLGKNQTLGEVFKNCGNMPIPGLGVGTKVELDPNPFMLQKGPRHELVNLSEPK